MDAFKTPGYSVSKGSYSTDEWQVGKDPETGANDKLKKTTKSREYDNLFLKSKSIFQNTVKTY